MPTDSSSRSRDSDVVARLGLKPDSLVHIVGWGDDCGDALLEQINDAVLEVVLDEATEVVDAVLLWWRDYDGDLADGLLDALAMLADGGAVWLLTPKPGRDGHMSSPEVKEAVQVAGMQITTTIGVGTDWQAAKLTAPKGGR